MTEPVTMSAQSAVASDTEPVVPDSESGVVHARAAVAGRAAL